MYYQVMLQANMKIEPTNFKGIEYVQVNQLPEDQQALILQTISSNLYIKILIDGKIIGKCLQYKDYDLWYHNVFKPGDVLTKVTIKNSELLEPVAKGN
ncbi:hypothetical protein [Ohtaekwangia sp.]|uniref:hypothetical protein n=1 Tax=Ohtaekwangia sp. TaxID=2066019 RepID=UPI002F958D38